MAYRRIVVVFGLSGWTKTGDKIKMHRRSRSEAVMDILMTTILSGLGFLISICDLNGASLFADVLFWWSCYLLWWTFLPVKTTLCLFRQSLDADDLRFYEVSRTCTLLGRELVGLHRKGKVVNGTCMKWALGNRSNSAGIGLPM
jgi:hypothetical protein